MRVPFAAAVRGHGRLSGRCLVKGGRACGSVAMRVGVAFATGVRTGAAVSVDWLGSCTTSTAPKAMMTNKNVDPAINHRRRVDSDMLYPCSSGEEL